MTNLAEHELTEIAELAGAFRQFEEETGLRLRGNAVRKGDSTLGWFVREPEEGWTFYPTGREPDVEANRSSAA